MASFKVYFAIASVMCFVAMQPTQVSARVPGQNPTTIAPTSRPSSPIGHILDQFPQPPPRGGGTGGGAATGGAATGGGATAGTGAGRVAAPQGHGRK